MSERPAPGAYVHYKNGKHYTVIDVVRHSETEELMVLYRAEYGDYSLWVRPLAMFLEIFLAELALGAVAALPCSAEVILDTHWI